MFAKVIASLEWNVCLSGLQLCNTAPRSPVQGRLHWVLILTSRGFSTSMFHVVLVFNSIFSAVLEMRLTFLLNWRCSSGH